MRKILAVTLLLLFVFSAISVSIKFWASKKLNKYHYPDCKWAQKMKPENLIKFKTPEEAIKTGYIPCKVCNPPIVSEQKEKYLYLDLNHDIDLLKTCFYCHYENLDGSRQSFCKHLRLLRYAYNDNFYIGIWV